MKQYGNWMYTNSDPTNDDEIKSLLTENMNQSAKAGGLDISQAEVEYVFKEIPNHLKMSLVLDPHKEWWSAAWKVTL